MKLSQHSKERIVERTSIRGKDKKQLFKQALEHGKSFDDIKDIRLKSYIASRKNCRAKIYKDYIFLYSKNSKQLYTMYELPEKYKM